MAADPQIPSESMPVRELERLRQILWKAGLSSRTSRPRGPENRLEQRIELMVRAACMIPGQKDLEQILVRDLSPRGLQFRIRKRLEVGQTIRVILCMPGTAPCQMEMEIRWVAAISENEQLMFRTGAALTEYLSAD